MKKRKALSGALWRQKFRYAVDYAKGLERQLEQANERAEEAEMAYGMLLGTIFAHSIRGKEGED